MRKRRRKGDENGPQTLGALAILALADLAGPERSALIKVLRVWPAAVGKRVSEAARPARLIDGILTVEVESPVWSQQLSMMAPRLLEELERELGDKIVRELRFSAARHPLR
jgi:predicted nucleic acid-binding Zn ribbon protein